MRTWVRREGDFIEPNENVVWVMLDDGSWLTFFANGQFEHHTPQRAISWILHALEKSTSFNEVLG